ncbi:hypothetical protein [Dermacoccus abyssi]|uniref:hypothetical protein n=1 Tax=Dermacoccus abyssi TaxID=322596 RepID=UPI001F4D8BB2|nr:hypothetical protein [Dermacoccus abyssi]
MAIDLVWIVLGFALLLAVFLPTAVERFPLSTPMVLLGVGAIVGLAPMPKGFTFSPQEHEAFVLHASERRCSSRSWVSVSPSTGRCAFAA